MCIPVKWARLGFQLAHPARSSFLPLHSYPSPSFPLLLSVSLSSLSPFFPSTIYKFLNKKLRKPGTQPKAESSSSRRNSPKHRAGLGPSLTNFNYALGWAWSEPEPGRFWLLNYTLGRAWSEPNQAHPMNKSGRYHPLQFFPPKIIVWGYMAK